MVFEKNSLHRNAAGTASCWRVALAAGYPAGHKQRQGDLKTPEGWYRTSDKPWSQFYGAIAVHYPNVADAEAAVKRGALSAAQKTQIARSLENDKKPLQNTALGGEILIHGGGSFPDWTLGCVALDNADLDRLRALVKPAMKTDVLILP